MSIVQLGYVGFGVSDADQWSKFGTEVLGLAVAGQDEDGATTYRMDGYAQRIIVHASGEDDIVYAGWFADDLRGFHSVRAQIEGAGYATTDGTDEEKTLRRVARMFWLEDPEGLRHEVAFNPTHHVDPFVPGRAIHGFKADELGLGHVVLRVDDFAGIDEFITDVLGMRLTDYGTGRLGFFRCNRRHHSIAIAPRQFFPGDKRIIHLMLEVRHLDDLGTAMDLCGEYEVPIPQALGRHTNDNMVSFYMTTPSDWEIEYGFGGREIEEGEWTVKTYSRKDTWGHARGPK